MGDSIDADAILARLDRVRGVGSSEGGLVRATVDGHGAPSEVAIDPAALRLGAQALGVAVAAAVAAAREDLQAQIDPLIRDLVGAGDADFMVRSPAEAVEELRRQMDTALADFEVVRRLLLDRLLNG